MSSRNWSACFAVVSLFFSLFAPSAVEGVFASVKARGMGGVGVARPQDALAAAYNPAGMVYMGDRADIGAHARRQPGYTIVSGSIFDNANGTFSASRGSVFGTPDFGVNWMVAGSCDVSLGAVGYTRHFFKGSYASAFPALGTTPPCLEFWEGVLAPVAALRWERFSVGFSVDFVWQRIKVNGLERITQFPLSIESDAATNRKHGTCNGIAYSIGGMWKWTNCLTIGGMYQTGASLGPVWKYSGLFPHEGSLDTPSRTVGGFYWRPESYYGIAVDIEHIGWRHCRWWHHNLPRTLELIGQKPFGTCKGPGMGWGDQIIARVGGDWKICTLYGEMVLRAGYSYGQSPIKSEQTMLNALTMNLVEQELSVGVTIKINECSEISGYYAYGFPWRINGKEVTADFGSGTYDLQARSLSAGISIGWNW